MRPTNLAARTAHLAVSANGQQTVCRSCRSRQFHTSPSRNLDPSSFFGGLTAKVFGTKESKAAEERREAAQVKAVENRDKAPTSIVAADKKTYKFARMTEPSIEGVLPDNWFPLIGTEKWAKKQGMKETVYVG
jgi:hypothetical protein